VILLNLLFHFIASNERFIFVLEGKDKGVSLHARKAYGEAGE
jgi:hypothetical protein